MVIRGLQIQITGITKPPEGQPKYVDVSFHYNIAADTIHVQAIWGQTPNYTREGGSIPVTLTFAENLGVNVLLLPMGRGDDGAQ